MKWNLFLSLFLLAAVSASSSTAAAAVFLSDNIFGSEASIGRNLLQAKTPCPVNFEFKNYTIITSRCKGPQYPPNLCCSAFKDFACPYAEDLNDLSNDCSSTMFSYINLYGRYPPGLFASECRDGKLGLDCPALPPSEVADASSSQITRNPCSLLMLTVTFLIFSLRWFWRVEHQFMTHEALFSSDCEFQEFQCTRVHQYFCCVLLPHVSVHWLFICIQGQNSCSVAAFPFITRTITSVLQ